MLRTGHVCLLSVDILTVSISRPKNLRNDSLLFPSRKAFLSCLSTRWFALVTVVVNLSSADSIRRYRSEYLIEMAGYVSHKQCAVLFAETCVIMIFNTVSAKSPQVAS